MDDGVQEQPDEGFVGRVLWFARRLLRLQILVCNELL